MRDLTKMLAELERRYPVGFPYDRNNFRLGIAALEDETREVYEEWRLHKRHLDQCRIEVRTELLQVAAVALMMVKGIDA